MRSNRTAVEDEYDRPTGLPAQIPARGWMDILLRVYQGFSEDRILANAAGVTYYALLGLFPGIAAVVSIYGIFADPSTIVSQVNAVAGFVPGGGIDVIRDELARLFKPRQHDAWSWLFNRPCALIMERQLWYQGPF